MDARLNMSLDDLIKSKPRSGGPGRGDRAGKARQGSRGGKGGKPAVAKARAPMSKQSTPRDVAIVQPKAHDAHSSATVPVAHSAVGGAGRRDDGRVPDRTVIVRPSSAKGGILSRLGSAPKASSGTAVRFEGLNFDVMYRDLVELCSTVGDLLSGHLDFDKAGRSMGTGTVVFARRSDAIKAVQLFNGQTLDGSPMRVALVEVAEHVHGRPSSSFGKGSNSSSAAMRGGLFGSALNADGDVEETADPQHRHRRRPDGRRGHDGDKRSGQASVKINLGYPQQTSTSHASTTATTATSASAAATSHRHPINSGRGRGGRRNGEFSAGGSASAADLDASLDDYFANRNK